MTQFLIRVQQCDSWSFNPVRRLWLRGSTNIVVLSITIAAAVDMPALYAEDNVGAVSGRVTYRGKVPRHEVSDLTGNNAELFAVQAEHGGLREVVVFLEPRDEETAGRVQRNTASAGKPAERERPEVVIDQKDYVFVPHLVAVRAGQTVRFSSSDVANHNVRAISLEPKNQFNRFTGGGESYSHRFVLEKKNRPVRIGCDLHRWMGAWVFVFDHDRFAVTGAEGKYTINRLLPGKYVLSIRQPDGGLKLDRDVEIAAGSPLTIDVEFTDKDLRLE